MSSSQSFSPSLRRRQSHAHFPILSRGIHNIRVLSPERGRECETTRVTLLRTHKTKDPDAVSVLHLKTASGISCKRGSMKYLIENVHLLWKIIFVQFLHRYMWRGGSDFPATVNSASAYICLYLTNRRMLCRYLTCRRMGLGWSPICQVPSHDTDRSANELAH